MCPLIIDDFPASVRDNIQDLILALDLVPLKVTKDDEPEFYWSCYSDSDYISLLAKRESERQRWFDNALQSQDEFFAEHTDGEYIRLSNDIYQLTLPGF